MYPVGSLARDLVVSPEDLGGATSNGMEEQNNVPVISSVEDGSNGLKPESLKEERGGFWPFFEKNFLAMAILISGFMISGSLLYVNLNNGGGLAQINQDPQGNTIIDVSADDDPVLGNKKAKVTIIEFSDYQCPFCRSFWQDAYQQIKKEYIDTGKVKLVYRDYPLSFHQMAGKSAEAGECADEQGKYWEMHDKMFSEQAKLGQGTVQYTVNDLKSWAAQLGVNTGQFNQCLDSGKYKTEVEKDLADGSSYGANGTPSFFINGRLLVGAQPFSAFKAIIEEELNKK